MTLPVVLGIAGCIAFLVGLFGGGVKAKEIEVPKLPFLPRILSSIGGLILIGVAIFVYITNPSATQNPATATPIIPVSGAPTTGVSSPETSTLPILTVQIWNVVKDQKNTLVASERFNSSGTEATLQPVGTWVASKITQIYDLTASQIQVHVYVPADLTKGNPNIQLVPPIPIQTYFSVVEEGLKSREPVAIGGDQALANLNKDFDLEIDPIGYEIKDGARYTGPAIG